MAVKQILGKVTVTPKGEYSSSETYKRLDIVTSNGQSYIAKVDNTGVDVTNTNTWLQLVEKPEKGIDYFTEEDIAQLVSMVTDDSESEFNEYYNGKVSDFDSNASSKTSEFNSNYDEKVESFNTIFDTSTDNFDGNYETKLSAFNENASTQTSTFNSVVEQATSDFNSNASTLTETFNTNASEKTSAFNINASEKTQEFNDNVDEKTEQITSQLDNYVQFDNYPSNEKAGVIKPSNNFMVDPSNGYVYAEALDATSYYENTDSSSFISKGTLENIKDDYVGSATPVKNLNTITPKNNAEGTDNTFDDGLESPLYGLVGDGQSIQDGTPTPDTPVEINSIEGSVEFACRGKNLFNKNTVVDGYISQTGQIESNSGFKTSDFIKVMSNTSYFLNDTNTRRLKFYDINKNAITSDWDLTSAGSQSFTTLRNAYYLRFSIDINVIDINTVQLELGTQATSYEPYIEPNEVTFNLNDEKLRSVGDVKDELVVDLDTGDYYKVENVGEVVFDGSDDENWSLDDSNRFVIYDMDKNVASTSNQLCNMASNFDRYASSPNTFGLEYDFIRIYNTANLTLEEWKTLITTTNLIISCELQTPTTKKLGTLSAEDLAKLKTFKGYNNVTVNTNLGLMNIRFTYGLDIKKYVDNKLAEISTAMIEEG